MISSVISNRDSWPFKQPVDENFAPMYYEVIQNPIDLSVIQKKINNRMYTNFHQVEDDFKLLVNNCETYNGPRNDYTILSYAIWKVFKRAVKKYLDIELSYDERTAFMYPPRVNINVAPRAAIEARKRKKNIKKIKALEILAQAAEEAVKVTDREAINNNNRLNMPHLSPDSNVQTSESQNYDVNQFNLETKQVSKPSFILISLPENLSLNLDISSLNKNLTFKSLDEWSESIKKSNNNHVMLPRVSLILEKNNSTYLQNNQKLNCIKQKNKKDLSENLLNGNEYIENENRRLILKLSRCHDNSGNVWKPVHISDKNESCKNKHKLNRFKKDVKINPSEDENEQTFSIKTAKLNTFLNNCANQNFEQLKSQMIENHQEKDNATNFQSLSFNNSLLGKDFAISIDFQLMSKLSKLLNSDNHCFNYFSEFLNFNDSSQKNKAGKKLEKKNSPK